MSTALTVILSVTIQVFTAFITCKCVGQYSGKTTVGFGKRYPEHWKSGSSSVHQHLQHRKCTENPNEVKMQFLENIWGRGKYSLSEREYLWTRRLKGVINIQKVLRNWFFLAFIYCYWFCAYWLYSLLLIIVLFYFSWWWPCSTTWLKHVLNNNN